MIKNIVLIGVGGIGSRHLQALAALKENIIIHVVDPSQSAIDKAKDLISTTYGDKISNILYYTNQSQLPRNIEVAIIAVTSGIRRYVTEELISKSHVKYIIFEKVLFNRMHDYYDIQKILVEKNIFAWVNCPRRVWDFYNRLKPYYHNSTSITMSVCGKNWGLGCNSIHELDLLQYLSGRSGKITIDGSGLDKETFPSKRTGYIEFTGSLKGNIGKDTFIFTSLLTDVPSLTIINSDVCNTTITETTDKIFAKIVKHTNNELISEESIECPMQYVSTTTTRVVFDLLYSGTCQLTPYDESMQLHIPIINAFLDKINHDIGQTDICNIT